MSTCTVCIYAEHTVYIEHIQCSRLSIAENGVPQLQDQCPPSVRDTDTTQASSYVHVHVHV